jgi:ubiquinone/menaquinone biosynthesis C-methylase UbiE
VRTEVDGVPGIRGTGIAIDRDPRFARYMSKEGAELYRRKYDRSFLRRLSCGRERALVGRAIADLGARGDILDVPCGAGRLTDVLLERAERAVCADVSPAMLTHARRALRAPIADGRVELARATVGALPFSDDTFDSALCWRLLHHMAERSVRVRALAELGRVSRRGVVASFADADTWKSRIRRLHRSQRHSTAVTRDELASEASDAGLRVVKTYRLSSLFSHLGAAVLVRA